MGDEDTLRAYTDVHLPREAADAGADPTDEDEPCGEDPRLCHCCFERRDECRPAVWRETHEYHRQEVWLCPKCYAHSQENGELESEGGD